MTFVFRGDRRTEILHGYSYGLGIIACNPRGDLISVLDSVAHQVARHLPHSKLASWRVTTRFN